MRRIASGRDGRGSGWREIQASSLFKRPRSIRARTSSLSTIGRPRPDFLRASIDMPNLYAQKMRATRGLEHLFFNQGWRSGVIFASVSALLL
jgi:hypothetical protein